MENKRRRAKIPMFDPLVVIALIFLDVGLMIEKGLHSLLHISEIVGISKIAMPQVCS